MTLRTLKFDDLALRGLLACAGLLVACNDDVGDDEIGETGTDSGTDEDPDGESTSTTEDTMDSNSMDDPTESSESMDGGPTESDSESDSSDGDPTETGSTDATETGSTETDAGTETTDGGTETGEPLECPDGVLDGPLPITVMGDNAGQGDHTQGECVDGVGGLDVAYAFVAPNDGLYVIDTFGSSFDTVLYVEDGLCMSLDQLACNDDEGEDVQSQVQVELVAGQEITIHVDGFADNSIGPFVVNVDQVQIVCPEATDIGMAVPTTEMGVLDAGPGEVFGSCGGNGNELAFAWTAPADGAYSFDTFGSAFDTVLYVREDACGPELDCNDDAADELQSQVFANLVAGQTVVIVLDAFNPDGGGSYVLNITAG